MEIHKNLFKNTILAYVLMQFKHGVRSILNSKRKTALALFLLVFALVGFARVTAPASDPLTHLLQPIASILYVAAVSLAFGVTVTLSSIPRGVYQNAQAFICAKVQNAAGKPPLMLHRREDEYGTGVLELFTRGIPLAVFQEKIESINSALNCHITRVAQGDDKQKIMLYYSPGNVKLPDTILLPQNIPVGPSQILLSESLEGPVIWDMNAYAGALIGGSTGSGKTTLNRSIIKKLIEKKDENGAPIAHVKIIDMKGGMDYPYSIKNQAEFANNPDDALSMLSLTVREMERRKIMFAQLADFERLPVNNLEDYNRRHPESELPRIVVVADELADLTETYPGMDKPAKERAGIIINHLERLARQGCALGITPICCLQRPDAAALPGSIKNNLNLIVARKFQPVLSQILLGNNGRMG